MNFPRSFTISAPDNKTDYSILARDMAFEASIASRVNCAIDTGTGQRVLSGWHKGATMKVTFFVSNPINEEAGREAVRNAIRELGKTNDLPITLVDSGEDYLLPLITGIPIGCYCGNIRRVDRKRDRKAAFLWDFIAAIRDGWKQRIAEVRSEVAATA